MDVPAPQLSFLSIFLMLFVQSLFTLIVLIVPLWVVFKKTGQNPALSLLVILPFPIGLWLVCGMLAFMPWLTATPKVSTQENI